MYHGGIKISIEFQIEVPLPRKHRVAIPLVITVILNCLAGKVCFFLLP